MSISRTLKNIVRGQIQGDEPLLIQQAAREELADLPPSALEPNATTAPADGLDVSDKHVISVYAAGTRAHRVHPEQGKNPRQNHRVARLHRNNRAAYYVEGNTIHVVAPPYVSGATAYYLPLPGKTPIGSYGAQLDTVIASKAALLWLQEEAAQKRADVTLVQTMPTPPTAPPAPSVSYNDANAVAPTATNVGGLPDAPQLATLTYSVTQAPSLSTLDLSTQIDNTTNLSPPDPPDPPSFNYAPASKEAPASTTISPLPDAPSFVFQVEEKPTQVSVGSLDLSTNIDDNTEIDPPSKTLDFSVSETLPQYSGPSVLTLDFADYTTYFNAEDPEMSTEALEKLQTEIRSFEAKANQALQDFQNEVQAYGAEVQKEAEQAGVDLQDFQTDLQAYQAEVERQVQEHQQEVQSKIEEYTAIGNVEQAFHQLAIEQERVRVQTELEEYTREVERTLQQAQLKAQEAQQTAQNAQDAAVPAGASGIRKPGRPPNSAVSGQPAKSRPAYRA